MRTTVKSTVVMFGGVMLLTVGASTARANCVELPKAGRISFTGSALLSPARGVNPAFGLSQASSEGHGPQIVGLWRFEFTSFGNSDGPLHIPDGVVLDAGYAQWHSDGTEIMNSSRDPVTGSICLGTWAAEGDRTYRLNHFGLSWDNTGGLCAPAPGATSCYVGAANIRERVSVAPDGGSYDGDVTITQYDTAQHVLFRLTGKVTARRVNP